MRVVVDTNVVVSGVLSPHGPPGRIVDIALAGGLTLLLDDRLLAEYREVLGRPRFGLEPEDVAVLLEGLGGGAEWVVADPLKLEFPDPADLPFVEVAVSGAADALVTGNRRHFAGAPPAVAVRTPAEFLAGL